MSSDPIFSSGGGQASLGPFTWGGAGPRRICNTDGLPAPDGSYGAAVDAGYYLVRDDKFGTWQWVKAGEMVLWDGEPDPVRVALAKAREALDAAAKAAGVHIG